MPVFLRMSAKSSTFAPENQFIPIMEESEYIALLLTIKDLTGIIMQIMTRCSPARVALALKEAGMNSGFMISPEEAFDVLNACPEKQRIQYLALTGNHLLLDKALKTGDKQEFVSLCEHIPNASEFLAACAMMKINNNAMAENIDYSSFTPEESMQLWENMLTLAVSNNIPLDENIIEWLIVAVGVHREFFFTLANEEEREALTRILEEDLKAYPNYYNLYQRTADYQQQTVNIPIYTPKARTEKKTTEITIALAHSFAGRKDKARALVEEVRMWQKKGYIDPHFNAKVMFDEISKIIPMPFTYNGFRKYYNN